VVRQQHKAEFKEHATKAKEKLQVK
jgi:hypothetical protein